MIVGDYRIEYRNDDEDAAEENWHPVEEQMFFESYGYSFRKVAIECGAQAPVATGNARRSRFCTNPRSQCTSTKWHGFTLNGSHVEWPT